MKGPVDLAFERLYRAYRRELYGWLLRETGDPEVAQDVLQTTFLNAYRALLEADPPREPRSWLYAIARNANRGRFRRQRVQEAELDEDLPLSREDTVLQELRDALATLPENQRAAILLQEVAGLSYAEIGERLGLTVGSVQMLVFRARRRLRAELVGRRRAGSLLPLQGLVNLVSRFGGDRAVLLRGAAAVAGAVALGGGIAAVPGDASSPPVRHQADVAQRPLASEPVEVRFVSHAPTSQRIERAPIRRASPKKAAARRPPAAPSAPPPRAVPSHEPTAPPASSPSNDAQPASRGATLPEALPGGVPAVPALPQPPDPLPPLPDAPAPPALPDPPALPPLPEAPALPQPPPPPPVPELPQTPPATL